MQYADELIPILLEHSSQIHVYIFLLFRNFPDFYYKLPFDVPGGKKMDIIMIDTVLLCGNTNYDMFGDQPQGPEDMVRSKTQWDWIKEQLESSK